MEILNWVIVGVSIFNMILAIMNGRNRNWSGALGWFCSSMGWFIIAAREGGLKWMK